MGGKKHFLKLRQTFRWKSCNIEHVFWENFLKNCFRNQQNGLKKNKKKLKDRTFWKEVTIQDTNLLRLGMANFFSWSACPFPGATAATNRSLRPLGDLPVIPQLCRDQMTKPFYHKWKKKERKKKKTHICNIIGPLHLLLCQSVRVVFKKDICIKRTYMTICIHIDC